MIDLKSKILLSEDPTKENLKEILQLAKAASDAGFNKLVATPSFTYHKDYTYTYESDIKKCKIINNLLLDNKIDITVYLGNEIDYSPEIIELLKTSKIATINNTQYILLKFNENKCDFFSIKDSLFNLQISGYIPIISQIERYGIVIEDPTIVKSLIRRGNLMQLDSLSILGFNGEKSKRTAIDLLKNDMIHIIGTSACNPEHYKETTNALNYIRKKIGQAKFNKITITNSEQILNNEIINRFKPKETKKVLFR